MVAQHLGGKTVTSKGLLIIIKGQRSDSLGQACYLRPTFGRHGVKSNFSSLVCFPLCGILVLFSTISGKSNNLSGALMSRSCCMPHGKDTERDSFLDTVSIF